MPVRDVSSSLNGQIMSYKFLSTNPQKERKLAKCTVACKYVTNCVDICEDPVSHYHVRLSKHCHLEQWSQESIRVFAMAKGSVNGHSSSGTDKSQHGTNSVFST